MERELIDGSFIGPQSEIQPTPVVHYCAASRKQASFQTVRTFKDCEPQVDKYAYPRDALVAMKLPKKLAKNLLSNFRVSPLS